MRHRMISAFLGPSLLLGVAVLGCDGGADGDAGDTCETDPCAGQGCGGNGTCRLLDCRPYCDCAVGYAPGPDLTCVDASACGGLGQACSAAADCCSNYCFTGLPGEPGYCSLVECAGDAVCANTADAAEMCCVPGPGFAFCHKIVVGAQCGDHSGTCGAPCAGALASACADDHLCWGIPMDDPEAHCASLCGTDDDCVACADPDDPAARFVCQPFPAGGRWCAKE